MEHPRVRKRIQSIEAVEAAIKYTVKPGKYKHFRGATYRVLGIAKDTERRTESVIYHLESDPSQLWSRPIKNFLEIVIYEGHGIKRFLYIGE